MTYFSRRNNHVVEFSGHEEASSQLRKRLAAVLNKYIDQNGISYGVEDPWYVEREDFRHEVQKEFPGEQPFILIEEGEFHKVFTVVEIFLDMSEGIYYTRRNSAPDEIAQAFELSGSVYQVKENRITLGVTKELAEKLESSKEVLKDNPTAYEKFFDAVGGLLGRRAKPEDVVKDVFIAFEDYLRAKTGARDYGTAIDQLLKLNTVSPTQKALLDKIYAYRSDTYGVGHAGNGKQPGEADALWFIDTVIAQLCFLDRKIKQAPSV